MKRGPGAIRDISISIMLASGWIAFLAAVFAAALPGAAFALPGALAVSGAGRHVPLAAGPAVIPVNGCRDDTAGCPDDGPPPRRGRVSRWEPSPERHAVPYEPPPPADEPCLEDRRPTRSYVYNAAPPPREYGAYEEEWCGVRCWYRRLRTGYCGRGCDYYRFRLNEFREGKLGVYRDRRYACRTTH